MIYTKEPANKVFVFVTAYRGHESLEVNEKMLRVSYAPLRPIRVHTVTSVMPTCKAALKKRV